MSIPDRLLVELTKICKTYTVSYVRLFGSALKSFAHANDIDLVVGPRNLTIDVLAKINMDLEALFEKPVDLVQLGLEIDPFLVFEVSQNSKPLYEEEFKGKFDYSEEIVRAISIAEDERIGLSIKLGDV